MEKRIVLKLNQYDYKLIIYALNEIRTKLINEQGDSELVNDTLLKVIESAREKRTLTIGKTKARYNHEVR